jgi:hypothetical protein
MPNYLEDSIDTLNREDSIIWDKCPYTNPCLHAKIRKAAHNQTTEVFHPHKEENRLGLNNLQGYVSRHFQATYQSKQEPEEIQMPQQQNTQPDPPQAAKDTITDINTPQQVDSGVSAKLYIIPKKRTHFADRVNNWR